MASGSVARGSAELCAHRLRGWSHQLGLLQGFGSPGHSSHGLRITWEDLQLDQVLPSVGLGVGGLGPRTSRCSLPSPASSPSGPSSEGSP